MEKQTFTFDQSDNKNSLNNEINNSNLNLLDREYFEEVNTDSFSPFTVTLILMETTKTSIILGREIDKEKDITVLKFKVRYQSEKEGKELNFDWEIYKTYTSIREILTCIYICIKKIEYQGINLQKLISPLENILTKNLNQYQKNLSSILEILNSSFRITRIRNKIFLLEFLEISRHSFDYFEDGTKPKEGYILKKIGSKRHTTLIKCICCCVICFCKTWQSRWFVLKDDMICYLDNSNTNIGKDIYWFDQEIIIQRDYNGIIYSIRIINGLRDLILKFKEEYEREIWYQLILSKIQSYKMSIKNIYDSFANEKSNCNAKWFVEAEEYFSDLYEKLMSAKESIYIAGWWVSPELFLKRPICIDEYAEIAKTGSKKIVGEDNLKKARLMDVLKKKAQENVQIHILIFKELTLALTVSSQHTKNTFHNLHPNILVTRHPKSNLNLLWSHHEKLVIVDQKLAYVGGIDLCWGRYDNSEHLLYESYDKTNKYIWPGIDYANNRIKDFENVSKYLNESINRKETPRMPWHDISVFLEGPVVSDLSRHFVERWNFARTNVSRFMSSKKYTIINVKYAFKNSESNRSLKNNSFNNRPKQTELKVPLISEVDKKNFIELQKKNKLRRLKLSADLDHYEQLLSLPNVVEENKNRVKIEMVPIQNKNGNSPSRLTIRAQTKMNQMKTSKIYLRRRTSLNDFKDSFIQENHEEPTPLLETLKGRFNNLKEKLKIKSDNIKGKIMTRLFSKKMFDTLRNDDLINLKFDKQKFELNENLKCQILRSASSWSVGLDTRVENSIVKGYYDLIDNSEHYILIENQFFISKSFTDEENILDPSKSSLITNEIALRIRKRIERAFEEKKKFRVYVFIPLFPAFPGEIIDTATLQILMKYTYRTISRNKGLSLVEKLFQLMQEKYEDYIFFFSLRTHGLVNNVPMTELVYIHSKMMIVDDKVSLIGSANINDRSMLGSRDSELAVIIRDTNTIPSIMDRKPYEASQFSHSLRIRLFKEHLGFDLNASDDFPEILLDPLDDRLFNMMKQTARSNTIYYREIFNCSPDNNFKQFKDIPINNKILSEEEKGKLIHKYNSYKEKIVGNIVEFPLNFLKEEHLNTSYFSREILVPIKNFI